MYMQLFSSHNDFSLNQFLSHCRHPLQVERSAVVAHMCIYTIDIPYGIISMFILREKIFNT